MSEGVTVPSPVTIMIGGGGAALARPAGALLVDDCGSLYHRGVLDDLGHTPDQLRGLEKYGFDPHAFAGPTDRLPALAVRAWLDQLASTSGPVVNGIGEFGVDRERRLVAVVRPTEGDGVVLEVEGVPTLAPGFPQQLVPGTTPDLHTYGRATEVLLNRLLASGPAPDDLLVPSLIDLLSRGSGPAELLAFLGRVDPVALTTVREPIRVIEACAALVRSKAAVGPLCFGDPLVHGLQSVTAVDSWIVAGGGDHALAAAEAVLSGNPAARVTVVAGALDAAAVNTARYPALLSRHTVDGGGDGRLEFRIGAEPGPITLTGAGRYSEGGVEADGYVTAIGRARALPLAVQRLESWVRGARGRIEGTLLFDTDLQYLGYRLHFLAEGLTRQVDVTGAASWFLPAGVFPAEQARRVELMGERAVPPESGRTATDLVTVVEQGARLAVARQRGTVRETATVPERWVPSA
ncbi:hypothetical protein JNUCC64_15155 [Streptomyces sp. JNUCC 64]